MAPGTQCVIALKKWTFLITNYSFWVGKLWLRVDWALSWPKRPGSTSQFSLHSPKANLRNLGLLQWRDVVGYRLSQETGARVINLLSKGIPSDHQENFYLNFLWQLSSLFCREKPRRIFSTERSYLCHFPALGWWVLSKGEASRTVDGR